MTPAEIRSDLLVLTDSLRTRIAVAQKLIDAHRKQLQVEYEMPGDEIADKLTKMLSSELAHYTAAYSSAIQALAATGYFEVKS